MYDTLKRVIKFLGIFSIMLTLLCLVYLFKHLDILNNPHALADALRGHLFWGSIIFFANYSGDYSDYSRWGDNGSWFYGFWSNTGLYSQLCWHCYWEHYSFSINTPLWEAIYFAIYGGEIICSL